MRRISLKTAKRASKVKRAAVRSAVTGVFLSRSRSKSASKRAAVKSTGTRAKRA